MICIQQSPAAADGAALPAVSRFPRQRAALIGPDSRGTSRPTHGSGEWRMAGTMNERVNLTLVQSYKRAERPDEAALEDTFVPITALNNLLRSPEHHILYGRRG